MHNCRIGELLGIRFSATVCRECEFCIQGKEQYCKSSRNHLHHDPGSFAEYCVLDAGYLTHLPDNIDAASIGPVLCAGVTVWSAIRNFQAKAGSWIVISGAGGGLGHLAVQYACAVGFRVIAIDAGEQKMAFCKELGAEEVIDALKETNAIQRVMDITNGGAHCVLGTAPLAKAFIDAPCYLRTCGTLACVGIPSDNAFIHVPVSMIAIKGISITGNLVGSMSEVMEAVDFVHRRLVKPKITVVDGLEQLQKCYEQLKSGKVLGRLVIRVSQE